MKFKKWIQILLFTVTPLLCSTQDCIDDPDFFKFLSGNIPSGTPENPSVIFMPCDTMFVGLGATVTVGPNTFLTFEDPNPNNFILIEGNFIVRGSQKTSHISGKLDTVLFSPQSMSSDWKGLKITKTGSAIFENVTFHGSEQIIQTETDNLSIKNSFFPDSKEIKVHGIESFLIPSNKFIGDFSPTDYKASKVKKPIAKAAVSPTSSPDPIDVESIWKSPWTYFGVGALAVVGGGATYILTRPEKEVIRENNLGNIELK